MSSATPRTCISTGSSRWLRKDPSQRYQHTADVAVELQGLGEENDSTQRPLRARARAGRRGRWFATAAPSLLVFVAAVWFVVTPRERPLPPASLVTLTAYPGENNAPARSPDGKQVAFSWNGGRGNNTDIHVQFVGDTRASRLTTGPHNEVNPCWSPDGQKVAFHLNRNEDSSEIWIAETESRLSRIGGGARASASGRSVASRAAGEENPPMLPRCRAFASDESKYANVADGWMGIAFIEACVKSRKKKGAWTAMPRRV